MNENLAVDGQEPDPPPKPFRIEEAIAALAMGLICLISFANVVVRYATDVSFAFTEEYSVFLLVVVTFVGASLAFATNDHIRIAYFAERMGPRGRTACNVLSASASAAMFAAIVYYGAELAFDEYIFEETSPGLGYPDWIYTIWLPILSSATLFRIGQTAWKNFRKAV